MFLNTERCKTYHSQKCGPGFTSQQKYEHTNLNSRHPEPPDFFQPAPDSCCSKKKRTVSYSVGDLEGFILDPDPALNFPSSGSMRIQIRMLPIFIKYI